MTHTPAYLTIVSCAHLPPLIPHTYHCLRCSHVLAHVPPLENHREPAYKSLPCSGLMFLLHWQGPLEMLKPSSNGIAAIPDINAKASLIHRVAITTHDQKLSFHQPGRMADAKQEYIAMHRQTNTCVYRELVWRPPSHRLMNYWKGTELSSQQLWRNAMQLMYDFMSIHWMEIEPIIVIKYDSTSHF